MPRRIALLLVAVVLLPACGGTADPDPEATPDEPTATAEEEPTEEPTPTASDDPSDATDADGLFTSVAFCVTDGLDDPDCRNDEDLPAAVCAAEWSPAAVEVLAEEGELSYEFVYDGISVLSGSVPFSSIRETDGVLDVPLDINYSLGGLPLASGAYECHMDDGLAALEGSDTVSSGPTEPVWGMAVCDFADTIEAGPASVCGEHVEEFVDVTHLNCSGGVAGLGDSGLRAEIVWTPPADTQPFTEHAVHFTVEPTGIPLHALNLHADASAFGAPGEERAAGEPLPTGEYTCRFSQGQDQPALAETTVTITES